MKHTTAELRQAFLDYFASKSHEIVPSSPLVPANDPTLLFTNAGMVQFKDVFLGLEQRNYRRAVSSQRCVRAGGKHNDLENVGYTARHHTFFEMLGNFSFGDYFKREAIHFSWEFLTQVLGVSPDKLWITVYLDDDEAADLWLKEIGVDPARFSRCDEQDNFWQMGDTGPCGPCSEIFYDHGPEVAGGPPGTPEADGDRYVEVWNLVFMQYNRDTHGQLTPLPRPSVDTGMGLERLAAVMQGVHSNYDIDLFQYLLRQVADLAGMKETDHPSLRVIGDHIRSCAFLVADGVIPANEGRGYVLRRIIRRALRHGHKLGLREPFFHKLVAPLEKEMGAAHPELSRQQALIEKVLKQEEERFAETLEHGIKLLDEAIARLSDRTLPGEVVFKLYDTYGFPADLTADVAREHELDIDMAGFERQMAGQRARARAGSHFEAEWTEASAEGLNTDFTGYEYLVGDSEIVAIYRDGHAVSQLTAGEQGRIVLRETPFYAESGGQVGDRGALLKDNVRFTVKDCKKMGQAHAHIGQLESGELKVGDPVRAEVDREARLATARNHSATHLLHAALRTILGEHVQQKGSLVEPERLRFDFSHFEPLDQEQIQRLERMVNQQILLNTRVETRVMDLEDAMNSGAMALFGEKYADQVRVLSIGEFSTELCGGTHVSHAGDIGPFKIVAEGGVSSGVRRLEAITGEQALLRLQDLDARQNRLAGLLKTTPDYLEQRIQQLMEQTRKAEKELQRLQAKLANSQGSDLASQAADLNGIKVIAAKLDGADVKRLRETLDQLKNKLSPAAIVLGAVNNDKIHLVAGVTSDLTDRVKAGELVNHVARQVGGKGGGRPDMAQAGGNNPAALPQALNSVTQWVEERL